MTLKHYETVPLDLQRYIAEHILPQYDVFDAAHQRDHAITVIGESMSLATHYNVNFPLVYTIAACHDIGLCEGREHHHEVSAKLIRKDVNLRKWFTGEEINTMADAAEDHRASSSHQPRTIYGKIVAEADRLIDTKTVLRRTLQYSLSHYPDLGKEEHLQRCTQHLHEKYAEGGYLKLWIPESANAVRLEELRTIIRQPENLRRALECLYQEYTAKALHSHKDSNAQ